MLATYLRLHLTQKQLSSYYQLLISFSLPFQFSSSMQPSWLRFSNLGSSKNLWGFSMFHSLLRFSCMNKLSVAIVLSAYYPSALRHCDCSPILSTIYLSSLSLTLSFRSMVYASISFWQLLILTNKKKYVTRKTICVCAAFAIGVGAIFATETAVLTRLSDERLACSDFCPGQNNGTSFPYSAGTIITTSIFVFCWLPSLTILLISTTWSCIAFKKYYTGGSNQLNRQLVSLPIILPASFILNTLFIVLLRRLVLVIIQSYELRFVEYWLFVSAAATAILDETLDGIIFQLILVYLNPQLFKTWKGLFNRQIYSNQVHPETQNS